MSVIRQLKNYFTRQNIYPQTVEQAIYDKDGVRLDNKIANGLSNPNILINGNFANPVNQRGVTAVNSPQYRGKYCIDRWIFSGDSFDVVNDAFISIKPKIDTNVGYGELIQLIEFPNTYSGKTLTLSARFRATVGSIVIMRLLFIHNNGEVSKNIKLFEGNGKWNNYSITYTIPSDLKEFRGADFLICESYDSSNEIYVTQSDSARLDIAWAKLEEGNVATPFRPRTYAEELLLCQRYYMKDYLTGIVYTYNASDVYSRVPNNNNMRVTPKVTISEGYIYRGGAQVAGFEFSMFRANSTGVIIKANKASHGLVGSVSSMLEIGAIVMFDAEL